MNARAKTRFTACTLTMVIAGCGGSEVVAFDSLSADGSGTSGDATGGDDAVPTGSASASATMGDGADSATETADSDSGPLYDVGADPDAGGGEGECGCGSQLGFSYIWVANSAESTVSKINTQTMVEEGRYLTRPDGAGNPSRTSVSLSGRAVAVANRNGGVIKIWARSDFCDPMANGMPGLQTSTGKNDVLPWGEDDCIAWYTPFDDTDSQRPIAWTAGEQDPATCAYADEKVWTARSGGGFVGAHLLDGDDGTVEATVDTGMGGGWAGQYGGAVDSHGNFWITKNGISGPYDLAVVYRDDLTTEGFHFPDGVAAYGITVDAEDKVWLSSNGYGIGVSRFDPSTQTWDVGAGGFTSFSGIVESADGRIWTGSQDGELFWFDGPTLALGESIPLDNMIKGVSVDVDGNVWAVTTTTAYKIDPDTMQVVDSYAGLDGPYTYSDMTGWALQNAACDPEG